MVGLNLWEVIDTRTLQEIQDKFAEVTGLAAIIADKDGRAITRPSRFSELCQRIRATELGRGGCFESDAAAGLEAAKSLRTYTHYCHAGLLDLAAPIIVDGMYVGCVLCGQVLIERPGQAKLKEMARRASEIGIPEGEWLRGMAEIGVVSEANLRAAGDLLQVIANYIVGLGVSSITQSRLAEEIRARIELEKTLREMELKVLQAQVNPHFLFNTLNTIARLALFENAASTQGLAFALSKILRYSLSKIDQLVPVKDELSHVKDYLLIQEARFGDRISAEYRVDGQILDSPIPILTLQPLVENAIVHGLEPKVEGGIVSLRGWSESGAAFIEIVDTGIGLPPERGNVLLRDGGPVSGAGHTTGLGITNVHRRLQHWFGPGYGLKYLTPTREGTRVQIRFPLSLR